MRADHAVLLVTFALVFGWVLYSISYEMRELEHVGHDEGVHDWHPHVDQVARAAGGQPLDDLNKMASSILIETEFREAEREAAKWVGVEGAWGAGADGSAEGDEGELETDGATLPTEEHSSSAATTAG